MSRRRHKSSRVDKEVERDKEEAAAFSTPKDEVLGKSAASRLKWLQKALFLAGKKQLKVGDIYDIVMQKKFVAGVNEKMGAQMKTMLLANLHLFSPKQQKYLQSDASHFSTFEVSTASRGISSRGRAEEGSPHKKRRKRGKSSSASSDGSSGEQADQSPAPAPVAAKDAGQPVAPARPAPGVDPRLFARGAADDF